eukprot:UN02361
MTSKSKRNLSSETKKFILSVKRVSFSFSNNSFILSFNSDRRSFSLHFSRIFRCWSGISNLGRNSFNNVFMFSSELSS